MNYSHLATKYIKDARFVANDRTYDGLSWLGPGEKPGEEYFKSLQKLEDQETGIEENQENQKETLRQERQRQARARALADAIPFEKQIADEFAKIRQEAFLVILKAKEEFELAQTVKAIDDCWLEISKAQEKTNEEALTYLQATDWYDAREADGGKKPPPEVLVKRQEARDRIEHGKVVYANWAQLRAKEMPSKAELRTAILAGGEVLERIKKLSQSIILKYPKPRKVL